MRFFLSLKKTNLQNAVAFCLICFKPLDTHKSIVHAYNKKDDKKYKDVYTFCESCILENSDKYEQTPIEETIIE